MGDGPSETLFPLQPRDLKRSGNCLLEELLRLQVESIYIYHVISIFSELEKKYISIDRLPYRQLNLSSPSRYVATGINRRSSCLTLNNC